MAILYHAVDNLLVVSALAFSLSVLLVNKSHWKLAYVDGMVWILHNDSGLLLFVLLIRVLGLLDGSEPASGHLIVVATSSLVNGVGCSRRYAHWLASGLDVSFSDILLLNWFMDGLEHCGSVITRPIVA